MRPAVIDTDVISFILKSDTRAHHYLKLMADRPLLVSFMTLAELERWSLGAQWGEKRVAHMRSELERFTAVASSPALIRMWAEVMIRAQAVGRRIDVADAWIAATALLYDADLITNNRSDFLGVPGIRLVSLS